MSPGLREGDWLRVTPIGVESPPRAGEVVVMKAGDRLVAHRLIEIRDGSARTRGDACRSSDSAVPAESLLGRVVEVRKERPFERWWRRGRHALGRRWRE
jgi:hypothetical protein